MNRNFRKWRKVDQARFINATVLKQRGELNIDTLYDELNRNFNEDISFKSLLRLLNSFKDNFEINKLCNGKLLIVRSLTNVSNIKICAEHAKKQGSCHSDNGECGQLHICKFYILSEHCQFDLDCSFGHDPMSEHNRSVFMSHFIDPYHFQIDELRKLFCLFENRNITTMPDTCKFYNTLKTCTNSNCRSLHLCRHFLEGTCKFDQKCKRNHDIREPTILEILDDYGFNVSQPKDDILKEFEYFYQNKASGITSSALKRRGVSPDTSQIKRSKLDGKHFKSLDQSRNRSAERNATGLPFSGHTRRPSGTATSTVGQQSVGDQSSSIISSTFRGSRSLSNVQKEPTLTICIHHLRGKCLFGRDCKNHHKSMIYQWQWNSQDVQWTDFQEDKNLQLEESFCQVDKGECYIQMSGNIEKVDFETMTGSGGYIERVQRLTTISSKNAPTSIQKWTTVWEWYWQDVGGKWKKYGEPDGNSQKCEVDSDAVEEKYLANPVGSIKFGNGSHDYILLFSKMQQSNLQTQTKRDVQRRPKFFKRSDIENRTMVNVSTDILKSVIPKEWSVVAGNDVFKHYRVITVAKNTPEFQAVDALFHKTMSQQKTIASLERIENGELWHSFCMKKEQMKRKLGKDVEERQLFHGTSLDNIEAICRQGFDFRFCGKAVGTLYGKGSYFATNASYSDSYTDNAKKMFIAKTLVGNFTVGKQSYVRPPPKIIKEPHGDLFDSCVDKVELPGIFVIFDLYQVYPQYLITYQ